MNTYATEVFYKQSFVDYNVVDMSVDLDSRKVCVKIDGAYYACSNNIKYFDMVTLEISGWYLLEVKSYDDVTKEYTQIDTKDYQDKKFHNICEFVCENKNISLKGFAEDNSGWTEWSFTATNIKILAK